MSVVSGANIGAFQILSPLGAGGMGDVYRARDTRLNREVALKVLPQTFAEDPHRMARFQREAQLLASLNHPKIAAIYGLEESGSTRALVMELVEGQLWLSASGERHSQRVRKLRPALRPRHRLPRAVDQTQAGKAHREPAPARWRFRSRNHCRLPSSWRRRWNTR